VQTLEQLLAQDAAGPPAQPSEFQRDFLYFI